MRDKTEVDLRANRNLGVYKLALYENIIGEALTKCGYDLYYYKRENSTLEQDFFVRTAFDLIPVEVKATDGRLKSLRTLIDGTKYSVKAVLEREIDSVVMNLVNWCRLHRCLNERVYCFFAPYHL